MSYDRSSRYDRLAPITPLIRRAKELAQQAEALERRIQKRFPLAAVALVAAKVSSDTAHIANLLDTYRRDQPEPAGDINYTALAQLKVE